MKKYLKQHLPIAYELYLDLKLFRDLYRIRKSNRRFYNLSDAEKKNMVSQQYQDRVGHPLDWDNLSTYTEKMQFAKLFDRDERKVLCSDKYLVRKWVAERIGESYLIPLVGVWDYPSKIDFSRLPEKFVIKTNHGSGDVFVIDNKTKLKKQQIREIKRKLTIALNQDYSCLFGELHYKDINPKVIAEKYVDPGSDSDLMDYKFMCFNGIPYFCMVYTGRGHKLKQYVYDMDWNLQNWGTAEYVQSIDAIKKPSNFDEMVLVAKKLSEGFSHVRVDLYDVNEQIYFGEMTFTNGAGLHRIKPIEADKMLGELWNLNC